MLRLKRRKDVPEQPSDIAEVVEVTAEDPVELIEENNDEIGENEEPVKDVVTEEGVTEDFRATVEGFAAERGIESAEVEAGIDMLRDIGEGWKAGALTVDMLSVVLRGLDYDRAVTQAREEGEIAGRNKQIDEKYMHPVESDGIPYLGGSSVRKSAGRVASIFDLARKA